MKLCGVLVTGLTVALLGAGAAVTPQPSHEPGAAAPRQPSSDSKLATSAHDDQAHQMQHMQHMEMCRQMMMGQPGMSGPGMMRDGMMGMMPTMGGDPKRQAEMMAMRGEMMKAMGEIMMKYAQRLQSAK